MKLNPKEAKEVVRRGYDAISYIYRADQEDESCQPYHAWLDEVLPLLPERASVLELGCGCGIPVAKRLAQVYRYTGVDLSPVQIQRAKHNAAQGIFLCADMGALRFSPDSFDAVLAFYSIIHVPLSEQPALFRNIATWLKPGGLLMATVGFTSWTGQEENWLDGGATMYWSHADQETYQRWLQENHYHLLWTRFIPEGTGGHTLILAQKGT